MRSVRRPPLAFTVLLAAGLLPKGGAEAQIRLGAEFRVNSYTTGSQALAAIAADSAGNFVVIWQSSGQDGSNDGVFGQRYDGSGAPSGTEFRVNSYTTLLQQGRAVAFDGSGNFVIAWSSAGEDGSSYGIFGQRYASSGAPLGAEFAINAYTSSSQILPAVAADSAGNFVVAWQGALEDGSGYGVLGQRYDASGAKLGGEFRVNSYTTADQRSPAVVGEPSGDFVVAWRGSAEDGSSYGVFGQRFASSGAPLGAEFRVNAHTTGGQRSPSLAADSTGNFVVVWHGFGEDGSNYGIFGQRFTSSGAPRGGEFQVNSYTTSNQLYPAVASEPSGNFVVVWHSFGQDGSLYGVFGQRYDGSGTPLGAEFRVSSYSTGVQANPAIFTDSAGSFVVAWTSGGQDGSSYGIFAQRFCTQPLTAVSVSTMGSLSVCATSTGGTATVTDTGGVTNLHQWFYRTSPMGSAVPIPGQTGVQYVIDGADFGTPPGTPGFYYLGCFTTPSCGSQMFSTETIVITVSADNMAPAVTPPPSVTATQTLCQ